MKSLAESHTQIIGGHTQRLMTEAGTLLTPSSVCMLWCATITEAAPAPPGSLAIAVRATGTETITTELSWFLFSFGHHCLLQF